MNRTTDHKFYLILQNDEYESMFADISSQRSEDRTGKLQLLNSERDKPFVPIDISDLSQIPEESGEGEISISQRPRTPSEDLDATPEQSILNDE